MMKPNSRALLKCQSECQHAVDFAKIRTEYDNEQDIGMYTSAATFLFSSKSALLAAKNIIKFGFPDIVKCESSLAIELNAAQ